MIPLEITVRIQPNAECITPLQLGNITYQYPTQFTTDKISEIVTTDAPIGYSRFAAIYGGEPSVSVSRSSDIIVASGGTAGSVNFQSSLPISSISGDADDQLYNAEGVLNPGVIVPKPYPFVSNTEFLNSVDTPRWSRRNSSVYFPQVDFFPRYNQWFASTIWSTPYDPAGLVAPSSYNIMFIYVDRTSKTVYHRAGVLKFSKNLITVNPKLDLQTASWGNYTGSYSGTKPWYLNIIGFLQDLESGATKFELFFIDPSGGDNLAKTVTANSSQLPINWGVLTPSESLGPSFKIKVVATSLSGPGASVTSNELVVSNPNA